MQLHFLFKNEKVSHLRRRRRWRRRRRRRKQNWLSFPYN